MQKLLLMCEDIPVMAIDFTEGVYDVLNHTLLPFSLKGRIRDVIPFEEVKSKYDDTQRYVAIGNNREAVVSWLTSRTLVLSRKNAKWLYNALKLEQIETEINKLRLAILCRGISVLDNYWLKLENDSISWDDVNIRHNSLNEVLAQIALHGKALTMCGSPVSPELTTNGAYAKAWRRYDGKLWLYKLGENGNTESRIEVMCSDLLDKMSVEHCYYKAGEDEGKYVCMCPCMSSDRKSILSGTDFVSYCNVNGIDPDEEMLRIDSDAIYKMWIVDYLLCNRDRHGQNWGFYYDPHTMEISKCHPLFDHNNAFDTEYMLNREAPYQFGNMNIRQAAKIAMSKVDFYFTEEITRKDFITERQYDEFMWRVRDLGIQVRHNSYEAKVRRAMSKNSITGNLSEIMGLLPTTELEIEEIEKLLLEFCKGD